MKKLRKRLYAKKQETGAAFVKGKGHHKSGLQKAIETMNKWLEKLEQYHLDIHTCGARNSYCKTAHDVTVCKALESRNHKIQNGRMGRHLIVPKVA